MWWIRLDHEYNICIHEIEYTQKFLWGPGPCQMEGGFPACIFPVYWGDYVLRSNDGKVLGVIEAKRCTPNWAWTLSQGIAQCVWQLATLKESQKCLGLKKCQGFLFGKVLVTFLCEKMIKWKPKMLKRWVLFWHSEVEVLASCCFKFYDHPAWCVNKVRVASHGWVK